MSFRKVILASVLLFSGCATVQYVRELPPAELLEDCVKPAYSKATNLGLAQGIVAYDGAMDLCNLDKKALRAWADSK